MKTRKLLMLLTLAGIMIFASCKKDDTPSPLTKEEAQTELTTTATDFTDIKSQYDNSDAGQMQSFLDSYSLPIDAPKKSPLSAKSFENNVKRISKSLSNKTMGGDSGDFIYIDWTNSVGTWTWNSGTYSWDHSTSPSDKVIIIFPYKDGTATLTYDNYSTKTFTYESESYTYVSSLNFKAEYTLSGTTTTVFSWQYTASRTGLLSGKLKFVYNLGDFSQTEAFSISTGTSSMSASVTFEVKYQGDVVYGQYATITLKGSQTGYSMSIDAKVRLKNIVVKWNIDLTDTTDTSNPNNYMKISVWTADGAKVADIALIYDESVQGYVAWFVYTDGTQEKVSDKLGSENDEGSIFYMLFSFVDDIMGEFGK